MPPEKFDDSAPPRFEQSQEELSAAESSSKLSNEAHGVAVAFANKGENAKEARSESAKEAPETMDQRIMRSLGNEIYQHLSNKDKDWDWLIAHKDKLAEGLMVAAKEGNFHAFMTEVNKKCPHILFENNPRPATRGHGPHLDYIETATADWLVKMERGFLRSNDRLMNYVQWSDYTTNISR